MSALDTLQILPANQQGIPQGVASDTDMAAASVPTFGQTFSAAYNAATDSTWSVQDWRKNDAYANLARELAGATGQDVGAFYLGGQSDTKPSPMRIWQEIGTRRLADPNFMKDVGADQADFEKRVLTRGGQYQIDAATAGAGSWLANLAGTAAAAWHDPFQVAAMGLGGPEVTLPARGIIANGLARVGMAGATNAAFAAAEEPLTIQSRAALGGQTTPGDVAADIGGAAVFGAAMHGAGEAAVPIVRRVADAGQTALETGLTHAYSALPDSVLAQHFADRTAPWERTPEEQAALNVLGRQAEIAASNPYGASYAAMAVHQARVGDATGALDQGRVPGGAPVFQPPASGTVTGDYFAKLSGAESGNSTTAKAQTSSASGLYQFTDGTWLGLYKQRFGDQGLTDAQILARKTDPGLQNTLVRDLTQHNADYLGRHNIPASDANLYLAHFAGADDAVKLIQADPNARVADIMRAKSVDANPWVRNKTVGELRAWAERKMGGTSTAPVMPAAPADDGMGAQLAAEDAENAAMDAEDATPAEADISAMGPTEAPLSVQTLLPGLRDAIGDKSVKLNDFDGLAQRLGASAEDVRAGLDQLVQRGELAQRSDNGAFTRARPPAKEPTLIEWIKQTGGIWDGDGQEFKGGDFAAMGLNDWYKGGPFRDKAPIIRTPEQGHGDRGADNVLRAAIEAGYFPELRAAYDAHGPDTIDTNVLHHAIAEELAGRPRYAVGTRAFERQGKLRPDAKWVPTPEEVPPGARTNDEAINQFNEHAQEELSLHSAFLGKSIDKLDPWILDRAYYLWHESGESIHSLPEALDRAIHDYAAKNRADALAATNDTVYDSHHEFPTYHDPEPEQPSEGTAADSGGQAAAGGTAPEGEPRGGADGNGGEAAGGSGPLDPEAYAQYDDPAGDRIAKAADSAWHDIDAKIDPAIAEREKQMAQLGAEAPLRKPVPQEGTMGLGLFDASDQPTFDLSQGDPAAKIEEIKAALDADQAALDAINKCL